MLIENVLKKLCVTKNKAFVINEKPGYLYKITKDGLLRKVNEESEKWSECFSGELMALLEGKYTVDLPPFIPEHREAFYTYVINCDGNLSVTKDIFDSKLLSHRIRCKLGIVFRSELQAESKLERFAKIFDNLDSVPINVLEDLNNGNSA